MYAILNSKCLKRHTNLTERQLNKKAIAVVRGSISNKDNIKKPTFSVLYLGQADCSRKLQQKWKLARVMITSTMMWPH